MPDHIYVSGTIKVQVVDGATTLKAQQVNFIGHIAPEHQIEHYDDLIRNLKIAVDMLLLEVSN